jgi:class 3 adenylate cyclase
VKWLINIQTSEGESPACHNCDSSAVLIGRDSACDVVINEKQVSKRHLYIRYSEGRFVIEDLASTNGTFIFIVNRWLSVSGKMTIDMPVKIRLGQSINLDVSAKSGREASGDTVQESIADVSSDVFSITRIGRKEAILVLDLCGSSAIANKNDTMAYHLKSRLEDIAMEVCHEHNATFYKNTGDGLLATFAEPVTAGKTAGDILYRIQKRNERSSNPPINVRLSLHFGNTYQMNTKSRDLHGNDINIAFRIEGLQKDNFPVLENEFPEKNRVLCSDDFVWEVRNGYPDFGLTFLYCGEAYLKGIRDTRSVFLMDTTLQ